MQPSLSEKAPLRTAVDQRCHDNHRKQRFINAPDNIGLSTLTNLFGTHLKAAGFAYDSKVN